MVSMLVSASVGILAGTLGSLWWARRAARQRRRIPSYWPLDPRRMASSAESLVWRWLDRAFIDHHVMIKVPVTRFTLPRGQQKSKSAYWHQMLNGVYCTFTVCASDGTVVGCVDVIGPSGISRSNRQLKLTLLSQCGIAYWVVKPNHLPGMAEIRAEFLGVDPQKPDKTVRDEASLALARERLRAVVDRQRHQRLIGPEPAPPGRPTPGGGRENLLSDEDFHAGSWQQPNSFIAPLDSRRGKLS
jgi:hypothetical protein